MTNRLNRKIALVTAAGQGIGRAISEAFIAEGATVIATDLDPGKLEGLAAARRDKLDVRSTAAVDAFAQQAIGAFGAPDILVNCAGFVHHGTVLDCSVADWAFSFDLNVTSIHRMLRAFLPGMVERRRGSIISISSAVSSIRGVPNRYVYGATKAAIIGLTKAVAIDFIKQGIRANAICPGTIQTPSLDGRVADLSTIRGRTSAPARHRPLVGAQNRPVVAYPAAHVERPHAVCAHVTDDLPSPWPLDRHRPHLLDGGNPAPA
jgi:2-keto-3-deoxy-L-fuconate dehydrogenase